ncbi:MAG: DNA polymerase III subunit [Bacteroidales bacterium]|jgi:DNA polymerase-3 subunit delta'|nr:DNA polymerase III subunit [Bacteroidales bacterium]
MQFAEIIGQDAVKQKLISTVHENRISHAQLFLGPGGSGKLALAVAYAQYINCSRRTETDSCGVCPSCQQIAKLAHPDIHFSYPIILRKKSGTDKKVVSKDYLPKWREYIFEKHFFPELIEWYGKMESEKKQGVIGADECNDIIKTLSYKSYGGKYKIMIIWMAELLYHSAAPKILKILEEPPEKTLFILIAERQEQIISTILSRTQIVKIPPLDDPSLSNTLAVQFGYDPEQVSNVLKNASGNVNRAINILEESLSGEFSSSEFREWMLLCYQRKYKALTDFVGKTSRKSRAGQKQLLSFGLNLARNCLLSRYGRDELLAFPDGEEEKFTLNFSKFINEKNAIAYSGLFEEAIHHIDRNGNAAIIFMDVSLKVARLLNPRS